MRGKRTALVEGIAVAPAAARLAELYVRHARSATQVAYLLTGDRAAAEDLVQDAFVRISSRLGHLRKEDVFATYPRKTVVILCRSN